MECGLLTSFLKEKSEESPGYPCHLVYYNISSIQVLPFLPSWHPHTYTFLTHSHARNGLKSLNKNSQGKPQFPMGLPNIQSIPSWHTPDPYLPQWVEKPPPLPLLLIVSRTQLNQKWTGKSEPSSGSLGIPQRS